MKINGVEYKTIWFDEEKQIVKIIDQTKLPHKFTIKELSSVKDAINAIKTMEVRGAPLIGGTAAFGLVLAVKENNSLDFIKEDGDKINAELSSAIIESIFHKNSPLHDGAVIVVGNLIVSSRVTLPVSKNKKINKSFGLRHKAAIGISEESDALCVVISEETGKISYIKNGDFCNYKNDDELKAMLSEDLSE